MSLSPTRPHCGLKAGLTSNFLKAVSPTTSSKRSRRAGKNKERTNHFLLYVALRYILEELRKIKKLQITDLLAEIQTLDLQNVRKQGLSLGLSLYKTSFEDLFLYFIMRIHEHSSYDDYY
jgi:hypothetical protein